MSREKSNKNRGVQFTRESAQQIAAAVRQTSDAGRGQGPARGVSNSQAAPHYLSKTTSEWAKGSSQTLTIYAGAGGSESPVSGQTITAWNKFSKIKAGKWVMLARCNGTFYVISAEC